MLFAYAWKGFWRRKTKSILTILGVALAVGLFVGVVSITQSVHQAVASSLAAAGADMVIQKRVEPCPWAEVKLPKDLAAIPASVLEELRKVPGVNEASGVLELWAFHKGHPTMVAGIDPTKKTLGPVRIAPREGEDEESAKCCAIKYGRYLVPNDDYYAMVTVPYMDAKHLQLGQKIFVGPDRRFEICGVVDLSGAARIAAAEVFIPLKMAQKLLGQGDVVSTIFVDVADARAIRAVQERARELIGPEVSFTTESNVDEGTAALAAVTRRSMLAVSVLVILFAMALLARSGVESVMERIAEVGLMKALGWRNADVGHLFMVEALYSGIIGGLVGCGLGWLIAWGFSVKADLKLPEALASFAPCSTTQAPLEIPLSTTPSLGLFLGGLFAALAIGALSGMMAARRAARMDPVVALRRI